MMVIVSSMVIMELYKSDMAHALCMMAMMSCLLAMTLRTHIFGSHDDLGAIVEAMAPWMAP